MVKRYLAASPDYPYCKGCGHTLANKALGAALQKTGKDPEEINIISDIGCVGLLDKLFHTNTTHTTHGRSTAIATGLALSDTILFNKDTAHIVVIGDGGATIGISHLIDAARMNVNITVLLHNNFLYGMTGGQHSGLTPMEFKTTTTMTGNMVPPLNIAKILEASGACFLSRKLATDNDLDKTILKAVKFNGFALVEIIALCPGYAAKLNNMAKSNIQKILNKADSGLLKTKIVNEARKPYDKLYKERYIQKNNEETRSFINIGLVKKPAGNNNLFIVIAGTAGEGVQYASRLFLIAAISSGLFGNQKNDNPVTVGSGFSMSELKLSSKEILYSGITDPDFIIITTKDGLSRVNAITKNASSKTIIISDNTIALPKCNAKIVTKPFQKSAKNKKYRSLLALAYLLNFMPAISLQSLEYAVKNFSMNVSMTLEAVENGFALGDDQGLGKK